MNVNRLIKLANSFENKLKKYSYQTISVKDQNNISYFLTKMHQDKAGDLIQKKIIPLKPDGILGNNTIAAINKVKEILKLKPTESNQKVFEELDKYLAAYNVNPSIKTQTTYQPKTNDPDMYGSTPANKNQAPYKPQNTDPDMW